MFFKGFNASKWKTAMKLAISRIKLLKNKRDAQLKQMKRDVAMLIESGQETTARIRVEHVIREQNIMAANEIIELFCELVIARLPVIESKKGCPVDLKEGISSLVFAAPRCADLPELQKITKLIEKKYGTEFILGAAELRPDCGVNRALIEKLTIKAPSGEVKLKVLKEIAREYQIQWDASESEKELLKPPEDVLEGPTSFLSASKMPTKVVPFEQNISYQERPTSSMSVSRMPSKVMPSEHNISHQEEPTSFLSASKMPTNVNPSEQSVSHQPADRSTTDETFGNTVSAAHAAALYADKAVAAAQAAAYLLGHNPEQFNQKILRLSSEFRNNPLSSSNKVMLNVREKEDSESLTSEDLPNLDNFNHKDHSFKHGGNILLSRACESQTFNHMHYLSDEENTAGLGDKKFLRRHSSSFPQPNSKGSSGPVFDDYDGSESASEEENDLERKSSNVKTFSDYRQEYSGPKISPSTGPPSRNAPSLPCFSADPIRGGSPPVMEDQKDDRRKSLPHVHPKLPDYESLAARFEALKFQKY